MFWTFYSSPKNFLRELAHGWWVDKFNCVYSINVTFFLRNVNEEDKKQCSSNFYTSKPWNVMQTTKISSSKIIKPFISYNQRMGAYITNVQANKRTFHQLSPEDGCIYYNHRTDLHTTNAKHKHVGKWRMLYNSTTCWYGLRNIFPIEWRGCPPKLLCPWTWLLAV